MEERKTKKHQSFSIEEKNQIAVLYLDHHMRMCDILRLYNIPHESMAKRWVKQYREFGTCVDRRGRGGIKEGIKKGRWRSDDFSAFATTDYHHQHQSFFR